MALLSSRRGSNEPEVLKVAKDEEYAERIGGCCNDRRALTRWWLTSGCSGRHDESVSSILTS